MRILIITGESNTLAGNVEDMKGVKALDVYGGSFLEARRFYKSLREKFPETTMKITSETRGLIDCEEPLEPEEEKHARAKLSDGLGRAMRRADVIIVLLGFHNFDCLYSDQTSTNTFKNRSKTSQIIFVGSRKIKEQLTKAGIWNTSYHFLQKAGVARIGKKNAEKIIRIIEGELP